MIAMGRVMSTIAKQSEGTVPQAASGGEVPLSSAAAAAAFSSVITHNRFATYFGALFRNIVLRETIRQGEAMTPALPTAAFLPTVVSPSLRLHLSATIFCLGGVKTIVNAVLVFIPLPAVMV